MVVDTAKIKAIANPLRPGATPTPPSQTGLTIFWNMIFSATQLGTGNLFVGVGMVAVLISIVVVGIYYVHKKRGG